MEENFEKSIFKYALILALLYQLYQIINGLLSGASTTLLNLTISTFLFIVLLISWRVKDVNYLAFIFHLAILPVLVYFWVNFGGLLGTVPLILFAYTSWIIISLKGWQQVITLIIYLVVFIVLTEFPRMVGVIHAEQHILSSIQLSVDFLVVAIIITAFLLYLKIKFVTYRKRIEHRHKQLKELSTNISLQIDQLRYSQEELSSINDNLEKTIEQRIRNIEAKNRELEEYAFINAHLVRGPLCRIIGLANLMKQEEDSPQIEEIRKQAEHVDIITRRINEITTF